jgi:formate dehydrogenase (coenzyme F420) alpha subunit
LFLLFGTNQAETHPVTFAHLLREKRKRGARMICIDPRQTPTAANSDEWIAVRPQTDLALRSACSATSLRAACTIRAFVDRWVLGFAELKAHLEAKGYTPEWAASRCDVPAAKIHALAELYAAKTKPAAIFCNAGISHQVSAFTTYRTLAIFAAITGNIGVPGGGCNFMHNTWPGGLELLASANTEKVKRAYAQLELYVYTGLFREEASLYADVLLPIASGFETTGVYMRRVGVPRYEQAANVLLDDRYSDNISGQQAYKCFVCRVRKA